MHQNYFTPSKPRSYPSIASIKKRDNYALYWDTHLGYQVAYNLHLHLLKKGWHYPTLANAIGITRYLLSKIMKNLKDYPKRILYTPSSKNITKINHNLLNFYPPHNDKQDFPFGRLQTGIRKNKKLTNK